MTVVLPLRRPAEAVCVLVTREADGYVAALDDDRGLAAERGDPSMRDDELRAPTLDELGRRIADRLKKHWRIK